MSKPLNNSKKNILTAKKGRMVIRMYRVGFGDCFLLAFPGKNRITKYMLIDCGVHHHYKNKNKLLKKIAGNIMDATNGHIDVVVATHEHTDHILGFAVATVEFKKMHFENVWMGWTENYNDAKVKELDKKKRLYLKGLQAAVSRLEGFDQDFSARLKGVLGFYDETLISSTNQTQKRMNNRQTMKWLQEKAKNGPTFCTPEQKPLTIDGVDDVRVFILGPPTIEALLKKDAPSGASKKETYLTDGPTELFDAFMDCVLFFDGLSYRERSNLNDLRIMSPFAEIYGKKPSETNSWLYKTLYNHQGYGWRKIDHKWWDIASELAIRMDNDTNNSSLVLAIELGKGGKVLLFPGDAQVGNWLSWQDLEWDLDEEIIRTDDLLARTVVYKAGHHCSHNATLKGQGLEKMVSPELTALIPVDERFANDTQGWKIPHKNLLARLEEKCFNRILRSDKRLNDLGDKPDDLSAARWQDFLSRVEDRTDYIDFTVKW